MRTGYQKMQILIRCRFKLQSDKMVKKVHRVSDFKQYIKFTVSSTNLDLLTLTDEHGRVVQENIIDYDKAEEEAIEYETVSCS